jgi:hypothetical protein
MVSVVSSHLTAVGAAWDDGPAAGRWIAKRLAPFGPSLGHAVPLGYPSYAIVPIPLADDRDEAPGCFSTVEAALDVLDYLTQDQPVHSGVWDGWAWWYPTGSDPRTADGMGVGVAWPDGDRPTQDEIDRTLGEAREQLVAIRVEQPDVEPLELPHRRYYLWTGPLRSALAFADEAHDPPSLIWPEDRSWFVGVPIYTHEIAIAGGSPVIDAILADPRLIARRSTPEDVLRGDD